MSLGERMWHGRKAEEAREEERKKEARERRANGSSKRLSSPEKKVASFLERMRTAELNRTTNSV